MNRPGRLSVWAPRARTVEVETNGRRLPLAPADGGWWVLDPAPVAAGDDYAFVLDGGEPLPDPRSPRQPAGVHGPSRMVDHAAFPWTDAGFRPPPLGAGVLYELHVGTFSPEGTFDGAAARLDHLLDLGVTHVSLMPVNGFPGRRNWGYDGVNLYAPQESYGGPEGLMRLVDRCHARGLAVLLDVVWNHLGPEGNHLERFGPYFTDRYATPWGKAVNLDGPDSDEVRRFVLDDAEHWIVDHHFDGLRIDAVHAILDTSATHVLEELAARVEALEPVLGREVALVAESDLNDPRLVRRREVGGYGLDAQWSDDLHHALHAWLTGERDGYYADFGGIGSVARALRSPYVLDGRYSAFRRRRHGREAAGLSGSRFVVALQTHDQVGNRARGERIGHLVPAARQRAAAALVLTSPFVPMLFQGEEWGASTPFLYFTDHGDPELGRAVREGRAREFAAFGLGEADVPDPQAAATFERSRLDWGELGDEPHRSTLAWIRDLVRLRRTTPALLDGGREAVEVETGDRWIRVRRGPVIVVAAFFEGERAVPLPEGIDADVALASEAGVERRGDVLHLPGDAAAVLVVGGPAAGVQPSAAGTS